MSEKSWANLSQQDLITYADFSSSSSIVQRKFHEKAYNGGCSLLLADGRSSAFVEAVTLLESSWNVSQEVIVELVYQPLNSSSSVALLLTTDEGNISIVDKDFQVTKNRNWQDKNCFRPKKQKPQLLVKFLR